jgi:hypothetical protein
VQKVITALGLCALLVTVSAARADAPQARFDGVWDTVVSCPAAAGALPYSYSFSSFVKDSVLHGERGTKGAPGWLHLDGRVLPDGSVSIAARGLVGTEQTAIGERPRGTPYSYGIEARFSEDSGTGHRVKGRACTVFFSKKAR